MERTPDSFTETVCLLREVTPRGVNGYPYRDVELVSDPVSHTLRFPEVPAGTFRPPDDAEEVTGVAPKGVRVYLVKNESPPTLDPASPTIFSSESVTVRVLLSEVASGRCCHNKIHPDVRDILFPLPDSENAGYSVRNRDVPPEGYSPSSRGRLVSRMSLVPKEAGSGYHPLPMIGYHGTSEFFIPDILTGKGLRKTTSKGLYGNNAYYFGTFGKAIRYAFRDSQYASVKETGPLRTEDNPAGYIRVPGTRHRGDHDGATEEDLVRDAPALVRFVLFPRNTTRFPEGDPVSVLPYHGTPKGGTGYGLDTRNRFIRFVDSEDGVAESAKKTEKDIADRVSAAMKSPLFTDDSPPTGVDESAIIPVLPPVSLENRQKAVLAAFLRTHVATRVTDTEAPVPSVILLRDPGSLPALGDFFLMTAGFLTNTPEGIPGDTITHICEDDVRECTEELHCAMMDGEGSDRDGTRPSLYGSLGAMTDHRILMEDLVSVAPKESPVLVTCTTATPESVVRMRDLLTREGKRPVLVIRAEGHSEKGHAGHDQATPFAYSEQEIRSIQKNTENAVSALGGTSATITYAPPTTSLFGKGIVTLRQTDGSPARVCSLRIDHTTMFHNNRRIMHAKAAHAGAYLKEYPTGGSYRVYKLVRDPKRSSSEKQVKTLLENLRSKGWDPERGGESDTLVIEPFSYQAQSGKTAAYRTLTQHTEIVVSGDSDVPSFLPLSWHRGDQRTMYRHHHPMDTGMRVI